MHEQELWELLAAAAKEAAGDGIPDQTQDSALFTGFLIGTVLKESSNPESLLANYKFNILTDSEGDYRPAFTATHRQKDLEFLIVVHDKNLNNGSL